MIVKPEPGDWSVCPVGGPGGTLIDLGEAMCGDGFTRWEHAKMCAGENLVLQAEPGGAVIIEQELPQPGDFWSTGIITLTAGQRAQVPDEAQRLKGTLYSSLDYLAIGLHRLHIPAPGLRGYIKASGHMICSQLVDYFMLQLGVHLFTDGRWEGYVMPADLGLLLEKLQ